MLSFLISPNSYLNICLNVDSDITYEVYQNYYLLTNRSLVWGGIETYNLLHNLEYNLVFFSVRSFHFYKRIAESYKSGKRNRRRYVCKYTIVKMWRILFYHIFQYYQYLETWTLNYNLLYLTDWLQQNFISYGVVIELAFNKLINKTIQFIITLMMDYQLDQATNSKWQGFFNKSRWAPPPLMTHP